MCENCGKKYIVGKYKLNSDQHHFCSDACRQKWYSTVYSQSDEWKNECRKRALRMLQDGSFTKESSIQIKINKLLDRMGISYENEVPFLYWAVDNYIEEYNVVIEINGDFWHCSPNRYDDIEYERQYKRILRDRAVYEYLEEECGITVVCLWEDDINNNIELCREIIHTAIHHPEFLTNRHSFNYRLTKNGLQLNEDIVIPYQDMKRIDIDKHIQFKSAG